MNALLSLTAPLLLALGLVLAAWRDTDGYRALTDGARKGLQVMLAIFPALLVLFPGIALLRASSLLEALESWAAPLLRRLGIPAETGLLLLLRPFSGSAALAAAADGVKDSRWAVPAALCADLACFLSAAWISRLLWV